MIRLYERVHIMLHMDIVNLSYDEFQDARDLFLLVIYM